MFTGIILAVGKITKIEQKAGDVRLAIDTGKLSLADANIGDSIAVNGICLTAVSLSEYGFVADVSNETLARTNLKQATTGTPVNLELALTPQTRMGGHIVSGHVDGLAALVEKNRMVVPFDLSLRRLIIWQSTLPRKALFVLTALV